MTVVDFPRDQVWPTASLWDAGARLGISLGMPPQPLRPAAPGMRLAGPLRRIRHTQGVASIFEGLDEVREGEVLLIDNAGLTDEACVGDLVAIEARLAGVAGLVVWGCHRDTDELAVIGLPVFSRGPCPASPRPRANASGHTPAQEPFEAETGDVVVADADGLLVVPSTAYKAVAAAAQEIVRAEHRQSEKALDGVSLRAQLQWDQYVDRRRADPDYTFRAHLSRIAGALE
ncbi:MULTISPECIES: RraA family protein [unclassified Streptomyces]|uniref:RraA family protein n=1 Tax=unclassified Streptomyces TaxID=2593676 RepID=UPI0037F2DD4F